MDSLMEYLRDVFLMIDLYRQFHNTLSKTAMHTAIDTFTMFPLAENEPLLCRLLIMRELMAHYPEFALAFRD